MEELQDRAGRTDRRTAPSPSPSALLHSSARTRLLQVTSALGFWGFSPGKPHLPLVFWHTRYSWSTQTGLKPALFSLHPPLFHLHFSFHTSCLTPVPSSIHTIFLPLLGVLPPSSGGETEAPGNPRAQGLPQAQPHRKPQPWVWHLQPKDTPREGRAAVLSCPDTPGVVPSTSPGNTSLQQGCPGGAAPQPPLKDTAEVTPPFLQTDRQQEGHAGTQGGGTDPPHLSQAQLGVGKADPAGSWHRIPLSFHPAATDPLGWERFSLFPELSNPSVKAVKSQGEPQGSHPRFPPSQPREAAPGTFPGWLEQTPLLRPPCWLQQQLWSWECPIPCLRNSCSTPRAGSAACSHSSAPGFIFAGTTGTSAGFAAPRRKPGFGKSCSQPLLAPAKHRHILPWHLGGGRQLSPPPTACSCSNSRISSCHGPGSSCWKGPASIAPFIDHFPSRCGKMLLLAQPGQLLHPAGSPSLLPCTV